MRAFKRAFLQIVTAAVFLSLVAAPQSLAQPADGAQAAGPVVKRYTSRNFLVHSDLDEDEAKVLLQRLETMLKLISRYWGQPNRQVIEMYVAKNINRWPADVLQNMDPNGVAKIRSGAGVTVTRTTSRGALRRSKSVVYSVAKGGTPQHEAVHAYCGQTFGRTGPLWYSEGMAEMGQYWNQDDPAAVHCSNYVIRYLKTTEIKSLNDIVNPVMEVTGDSWQNYAWRWALCHLLANNTNYAQRFRPLGLGLLTKQQVSFEQTYGSMADEIIFEYRFFIEHLAPGFRVDLCSWDWQTKFSKLSANRVNNTKVLAKSGWQPTRVLVEKDQKYDYAVDGLWKTAEKADPVSAAGQTDAPHHGRLVGVIFEDYKLSEPFELGLKGTFSPPQDGQLFVRCLDDWGMLADNSGDVTLRLRRHDADKPLPPPMIREGSGQLAGNDRTTKVPDQPQKSAAEKRAASRLRLGKLLLKRNVAKAREYFEEVIKLAPDSAAAKEAKELLAQ